MLRSALFAVCTVWLSLGVLAAPKKAVARAPKPASRAAASLPSHVRSPYRGAIVARAQDGKILFEDGADSAAYPASVTKLMTLLLVLEDVRAGRYSLDSVVTATPDVYRCEPSAIGLRLGDRVSVRDLCTALMVHSANDAAIALGVNAAGSLAGFVARMNGRAAELGMKSTSYYNPNGLPPNSAKKYPWKSFNVTTARDQLRLALRLVQFPETFLFTSVKTCDLVRTATGYRVFVTRRVNTPQAITALAPGEKTVMQLRNHNHIMVQDKLKIFAPDGTEAVDGLKTGFINAGGSSIILTGTRNGKRAIAVVLGSATAKERDESARRLMADALGSLGW